MCALRTESVASFKVSPKRRRFVALLLMAGILVLLLMTASSWVGISQHGWASENGPFNHSNLQLDQQRKAQARATLLSLPLSFEPNQGQLGPGVDYLARGSGYHLFLHSEGATLALSKPQSDSPQDGLVETSGGDNAPATAALHMRLVGADTTSRMRGVDELPGVVNYLVGQDPSRWRSNIPTYAGVRRPDVYPGIDLVYYGNRGNQRLLEYDFIVAPGADLTDITLLFEGADEVEIDASGQLALRLPEGELRQSKPLVYQEIDGRRSEIPGEYALLGHNRVGFSVGAYDATKPLIIDPTIQWSTYLGDGASDQVNGVAVNSTGEVFAVGTTLSGNWPFGTEEIGGANGEVFLTRLGPDGTHLTTTLIGGAQTDEGTDVAVDHLGNVYITGATRSLDFPTTADSMMPEAPEVTIKGLEVNGLGAAQDAFMTKLNPDGNGLLYSTYVGGNPTLHTPLTRKSPRLFWLHPGDDMGLAIAVDHRQEVYLAGWTNSGHFPLRLNAAQSFLNVPPLGLEVDDAFLVRIDTDPNDNLEGLDTFRYGTYFGSSCRDEAIDIFVDDNRNAYVTGWTVNTPVICDPIFQFPTTSGVVQEDHAGPPGGTDAWVAKFKTFTTQAEFDAGDLDTLVWSTLLGGPEDDAGMGIAVDRDGHPYVTGSTGSANPQTFLTKLSSDAGAKVWETKFGFGGYSFSAFDVERLDFLKNDLALLETPGSDLLFLTYNTSESELKVAQVDLATGERTDLAEFTAGSRVAGFSINADVRNVYVGGATDSAALGPLVNPAQSAYGGGTEDGWVAKIEHNPPPVVTGVDAAFDEGTPADRLIATFTDPGTPSTFTVEIDWGDGTPSEPGTVAPNNGSGQVLGSHEFPDNGTFEATTCLLEDGDDTPVCATSIVTVNNLPPEIFPANDPVTPNLGAGVAIYLGHSATSNEVEVTLLQVGGFDDAGNDTHTAEIQWEPGAPFEPLPLVQSEMRLAGGKSHVYVNKSGNQTVTLRVTDDDHATAGNGQGTAGFDIFIPTTNLSVSKSGPASTNECLSQIYNATVTNSGPSAAHNVIFADTLPDPTNMSFVSVLRTTPGSGGNFSFATRLTQFGGGAPSSFGERVAVDGNTAVAISRSTAMVYEFDSNTARWRNAQRLSHPGGGFTNTSVAISGNLIAIGSGSTEEVAIYERAGGTWSATPSIISDPDPSPRLDGFGVSVILQGNRLAVGAPFTPGPAGSQWGRVYVFEKSGTAWTQMGGSPLAPTTASPASLDRVAPFQIPGGDSQIHFGFSLAFSDDGSALVIGAPLDARRDVNDSASHTGTQGIRVLPMSTARAAAIGAHKPG